MHMPKLPYQSGHLLFNHLVGVIMFYYRAKKPGYENRVSAIMSLLWLIVPSVPNLYFSDLKQTLKRDHAENILMITANFGGTKDVTVQCAAKPKVIIL